MTRRLVATYTARDGREYRRPVPLAKGGYTKPYVGWDRRRLRREGWVDCVDGTGARARVRAGDIVSYRYEWREWNE